MTAREFDPSRLDVAAFAKEAAHLEGRWPLRLLSRLRECGHADAVCDRHDAVVWHAHGELLRVSGGQGQAQLHLSATVAMSLVCQRCLGAVATRIDVARKFLFVHGEDTAAQLDADSEDDVLALTRALDLRELIEDELLLALPLVPRHELCPEPLPLAETQALDDDAKPNPFAALAVLKRGHPN